MQLFKRMGYVTYISNPVFFLLISSKRPRVVLVEEHGKLVGLVTVKDVLRFIATEHSENSWSERARLDGLLEEAWISTASVLDNVLSWIRRTFRR